MRGRGLIYSDGDIIAMFKTVSARFAAALAASLAALACSGCAAPAAVSSSSATEEPAPRCVQLRAINGYTVLDDQHLILNGGVNRRYLVTTRSRCSGLRAGVRVATSFGSNARLCPPLIEHIIPSDGHRCLIDTVEEVESVEAARALIAARAAADEGVEDRR